MQHGPEQVLAAQAVQHDGEDMQCQQRVDQLLGGAVPAAQQAAGIAGNQPAERAVKGDVVVAEQPGHCLKGHQPEQGKHRQGTHRVVALVPPLTGDIGLEARGGRKETGKA